MCVDARGVPDPCVGAVAAGAGELLGGVGEASGAVAGGDVATALREAVDDRAALAGGGRGVAAPGGGRGDEVGRTALMLATALLLPA